MLDKFLKSLLPDRAHAQNDADFPTAFAALLVQIARADHSYDARERARIDEVLATRFGVPADVGAIRAAGEALEDRTHDTVSFTRIIKDHVPLEARAGVLEDMWAIVLADDRRDHEENAIMRLATSLLGLPDRESAMARQRVMARM